MVPRRIITGLTTFGLLLVFIANGQARMALEQDQRQRPPVKSTAQPAVALFAHRVGQIVLGVANNGSFGKENAPTAPPYDYFTGEPVPDCEYPKNSNISYLYSGAFWIGAVVGRDTLVSVGADGWQRTQEMFPDAAPFGNPVYKSIKYPDNPNIYEGAVSEEDYIAVYTDTLTANVDADFFGRPHRPLHIEVTQRSFAWSYAYAEDFVLFDYRIKNIGTQRLSNVYMGVYVDADVAWEGADIQGAVDDICGFLVSWPDTCVHCEYEDTVFAAWIADNDGDFEKLWTDNAFHPCPAVTATRIVRTPAEKLDVSFNWWIGNGTASLDFGPREKPFMGRWREPFRDYRTGGLGTPEGDVNKYYVLRNQEFDYDQIYTGVIQPNDSLWLYPDQSRADSFATGYDTRYLLSFGPFEIVEGQTLPISFAYVAGDKLHAPGNTNLTNLPDNPNAFYSNLNFSDLALNSRWASWVYDNPGVDTDGDRYKGVFVDCPTDSAILRIDTTTVNDIIVIDTVWNYTVRETCWIKGDGVPDFRGASPPPPPVFWVEADVGKIYIRFNGLNSETAEDVFSRQKDFEGYRVYVSRDERAASFMLYASYDREDYNKLVLTDPRLNTYELKDTPFTLEQLRCLYGSGDNPCADQNFNPLDYTRSNPYRHPRFPDSVFIFEAQDYNQSDLTSPTSKMHKIYPDQPYPSTLDTALAPADEKTEDGFLKYFEYEVEIPNLLPSVPYFVNVTAFDYGSPVSGLPALESPVDDPARITAIYPIESWDRVKARGKDVYVWPNPYRIDGEYNASGLEGRNPDVQQSVDRMRALHFGNLPPHCHIQIFTLDGDLVRDINHDVDNPPPGGTRENCFTATTDCWDLITRNTQLVVSGLYYWVVSGPDAETQIGKLVIIM